MKDEIKEMVKEAAKRAEADKSRLLKNLKEAAKKEKGK